MLLASTGKVDRHITCRRRDFFASILNVFSYSCCLLMLSYHHHRRRHSCADESYCYVMSDYCDLWLKSVVVDLTTGKFRVLNEVFGWRLVAILNYMRLAIAGYNCCCYYCCRDCCWEE